METRFCFKNWHEYFIKEMFVSKNLELNSCQITSPNTQMLSNDDKIYDEFYGILAHRNVLNPLSACSKEKFFKP